MNRRTRIVLAAAGAPGLSAQLAGLVWMLLGGEADLFFGLSLFIAGAIPHVYALERWAAEKRRNGAWAMSALAGPAGPVVLALLKEGSAAGGPPKEGGAPARSGADRVAGVALTALVTVGLLWAAAAWLERDDWPPRPDPREMPANERRAFDQLRLIAAAQERFRQEDPDGDGREAYSRFLVHLWRTVDDRGEPVPVGLISRRLAFAMGHTRAVNGYYYVDLHVRELLPGAEPTDERIEELYGSDRVEEIDPSKAWAMTARPAVCGESGVLTFLADGSRVYAKDLRGAWQTRVPCDVLKDGWTELGDEEDLERLQEALSHPGTGARR